MATFKVWYTIEKNKLKFIYNFISWRTGSIFNFYSKCKLIESLLENLRKFCLPFIKHETPWDYNKHLYIIFDFRFYKDLHLKVLSHFCDVLLIWDVAQHGNIYIIAMVNMIYHKCPDVAQHGNICIIATVTMIYCSIDNTQHCVQLLSFDLCKNFLQFLYSKFYSCISSHIKKIKFILFCFWATAVWFYYILFCSLMCLVSQFVFSFTWFYCI